MRGYLKARHRDGFWRRLAGGLGLLCAAGVFSLAPAPDVAPPEAGGDLGAESAGGELLQFEEFPTVVSVTRQASASNLSSVPVSVVTAKEIHERGAMTIPQLLEFVPGMDVIRLDRNRTNIGIRGMFGSTQDRILSLVDGQKTAEVTSGSSNWQSFPLFLEDIKQIEVVRGPSGAAWGANAFYGVINVLTKDPMDTQGFLTSVTADHLGDVYTHVRYGGHFGNASWRVSGGFNGHDASNIVLDRNTKTYDKGNAVMADSRLVVEADAKTKLTFGLSFMHQEAETPSVLGYSSETLQQRDLARGFLRYDMEVSEDLSTNWIFLYNYADNQQPTGWSSRDREAGIEGQFDYSGLTNHKISFGGSFRYLHAQAYDNGSAQAWMFADNPNQESWGGLFFVDRYQLSPRAWLEMQARGDIFKFNQPCQKGDWSGRLGAVYGLDEVLNHVVRLSAAKSYRAPTILLRATTVKRIALPSPPFPPNNFAVNVSPGNDLRTETIWSLEAGYTGRVNSSWSVQVNGFYHRYFKLLSAENTLTLFGVQEFYTLTNIDGAVGAGGELEIEFHSKDRELTARAYYAYVYFRPDHPDILLRANPPSPNKAGCVVEWAFRKDFSANVEYRYNDLTPGDQGNPKSSRAFNQMDLNLLYSFMDNRGELLLGVTDLFNDTAIGVRDLGTIGSSPESTPGRTFVARGQVQF